MGDTRSSGARLPLAAVVSQLLVAFTIEFDNEFEHQMPHRTTRHEIPALTGVAKMSIDNFLGSLEEHRYLVVGPDPAGSRFKVARLTPKGRNARDTYLHWADAVELQWEDRFGTQAVCALRDSIERLTVEPAPQSPLWRGIEPYPDGWRAQLPAPKTLPHYPVVSPRGGFPDGS